MDTIDPDTLLADLVDANPNLAPVLDDLGLDYCCGGLNKLADAVAQAGLDLRIVIGELSAVEQSLGEPDWAGLDLAELVDHIETTHHRWLRATLPGLTTLADKVEATHGDRHPELHEVSRLVHEIRVDLEPHLAKEEQILFPMIRQLAAAATIPALSCRTLRDPISVMLTEHDHVGDLLGRLRAGTAGFTVPADGCASYRALFDLLRELEADTHLHVHKENNVLFPAVQAAEQSFGDT